MLVSDSYDLLQREGENTGKDWTSYRPVITLHLPHPHSVTTYFHVAPMSVGMECNIF